MTEAALTHAKQDEARTPAALLWIVRAVWASALIAAVTAMVAGAMLGLSGPLPECPAHPCSAGILYAVDLPLIPVDAVSPTLVRFLHAALGIGTQATFLVASAFFVITRRNSLLSLLAALTMTIFGGLVLAPFDTLLFEDSFWSQIFNRWVVVTYQQVLFYAFVLLLLLFPDGRLVPNRPRLVLAGALVGLLMPLNDQMFPSPLRLVGFADAFGSLGLGLWAQIHRYRRVASPAERRQTKWIVVGFGGVILGMVGGVISQSFFQPGDGGGGRLLFLLVGVPILRGFELLMPISYLVSIHRFRLWDTDRVITRALLYATLGIGLLAAYIGLIFGFGRVVAFVAGRHAGEGPAVAAVAAIIIALVAYRSHRRFERVINGVIHRREIDRARYLDWISAELDRARPAADVAALLTSRTVTEMELADAWLLLSPEIEHDIAPTALPATPQVLFERLGSHEMPLGLTTPEERMLTPAEPLIAEDADLVAWHAAGARLLIPLRGSTSLDADAAESPLVGIWVIGRRRHDDLFEGADMKTFDRVGRAAAIVLDYARLHQRLNRAALLRRYLSPQIADSILAGELDVELTANRKSLTVFFSDIRGFTAMSERMEPEELVSRINEYLEAMTEIVFDHGGTLDKYIGDAIMVFVGDPFEYEDHQARAVAMALEMRVRLEQLRLQWSEAGDDELAIGIGITTGYVTVGNIGSAARTEYTVLGNYVNLASRLADRAAPGQILVSDRTYAAVRDTVDGRQIDEVELKGVSRPVRVYEILGVRESGSSA